MSRKLIAVSAVIALAACQDSPVPVEPIAPKQTELSVNQTQVVDELPQVPANAVAGQVVPDQYVVVLKSKSSPLAMPSRPSHVTVTLAPTIPGSDPCCTPSPF